jgi:Glucosamine 6-phosphate synthetase, contains amidotransferase and phosphosugar isomerase domains
VALVEKGFPVIAVVPEGAVTAEMVDFLRRLREREAELVVISAREEVLSPAQTPLPLPEGIPEWLSPMVPSCPGNSSLWG